MRSPSGPGWCRPCEAGLDAALDHGSVWAFGDVGKVGGGVLVVGARLGEVAEVFVGFAQVEVQGWVEIGDAGAGRGVGAVEGELVPVQGRFEGVLMTGKIVGRDAGLEGVGARVPGLAEALASLGRAPCPFCLHALGA